jgi:hypothetical protein
MISTNAPRTMETVSKTPNASTPMDHTIAASAKEDTWEISSRVMAYKSVSIGTRVTSIKTLFTFCCFARFQMSLIKMYCMLLNMLPLKITCIFQSNFPRFR